MSEMILPDDRGQFVRVQWVDQHMFVHRDSTLPATHTINARRHAAPASECPAM